MSEEVAAGGEVGGGGLVRSPRASLFPTAPETREEPQPAEAAQEPPGSLGSSRAAAQGGVLRKKLYDQNISDWSARYRKNKQSLENLARDCDALRTDAAKQQLHVDERAERLRQLEEKFEHQVLSRFNNAKEAYEAALQQKAQLQVQLAEQRKQKAQLVREKKFVTGDYERKHAELIRMAEARDRLDSQLAQQTQQLGQVSTDRRRMERELDLVQHNLRANAELAGEVHNEIEHVFRSVKDSMQLTAAHSPRLDGSLGTSQAVSPRTAAAPGQR